MHQAMTSRDRFPSEQIFSGRNAPALCDTLCRAAIVVAFLVSTGLTTITEAAAPPNIILILADDLGYGDLGCYGADDLQSPNLDALAARGMRFTDFYANCPVCSPTRAALMTGEYPDRVGVPGVIRTHAENNWGWLSQQAVLLPQVLKSSGYETALIGKWHLGLTDPNRPNDRGFDLFHGFLGDMMDDYYKHRRHGINYMRQNLTEIDPQGHATDLFTDWAIDFIEKPRDTPFFLYLAYNAPHTPIQPPLDWIKKVERREPGITQQRAKLVALIEHMDDGIGRVLRAIEATGQSQDTLIVFSSDNGGQLNVGANNGPLRDGKQSVYEGGLKVPTICVWPGKIEAGSQTGFRALSMDLYPTITEIAGADFDHSIDGRSIWKTLSGNRQEPLRSHLFFRRREGGTRYGGKTIEAVREGPWKLLQNSPFAAQELYNLERDPLEQDDVSRSNPRVFNNLAAALRKQIQYYGSIPWQAPQEAMPTGNPGDQR